MRFLLYMLRWQASTPVLALCVMALGPRVGAVWSTVIANAVGAAIFYVVDRRIFKKTDRRN